jgi:hypothetical protein
MDRDREVLAKRLEGERAVREDLQGQLSKLQRQTQALENIEEMLFKERSQRQRAERSIVELARSLGTLKAALLHAGVPVPPEARPSSALQNTVQVPPPACAVRRICQPARSASNCPRPPPRRRGRARQGWRRSICRAQRLPSPPSLPSFRILFLAPRAHQMCRRKAAKVTKFRFLEQTRASWMILTSCTTSTQMAAARRLKAAAMPLTTWPTFWNSCRRNWWKGWHSAEL